MRSKQIELYRLRKLVEELYGFDISKRGRRQDLVYAKKVYSKLARDMKHTFQSIGNSIGHNHATILHHYNSFNVVLPDDLEVYHKVLEVYETLPYCVDNVILSIEIEDTMSFNMMRAKYEVEIRRLKKEMKIKDDINNNVKVVEPILSLFENWSERDRDDFIEYRLKPYSKALKSRVFH